MDGLNIFQVPVGRLEELEKYPLDISKYFHKFSSQDQDLSRPYIASKNKYLCIHDLHFLNNHIKRMSFWNCGGLNTSLIFLHDFFKYLQQMC